MEADGITSPQPMPYGQAPAPSPPYGQAPAPPGITNFYQSVRSAAFSRNTGMVILIVSACLLLVAILAFVVYRFLVSTLKSATLVDRPVHAKNGSLTVDAKLMPTMDNGLEFCISTWLYSESSVANTGSYKDILRFGTANSCLMLWVMDKSSNRMYVALRLSQAPESDRGDEAARAAIDNYKSQKKATASASPAFMVVALEYLPLQRWVNVAVVVTQDIVTLYLDGDIYSVTSADSTPGGSGRNVEAPSGTLTVGNPTTGFNGFVSRLQVFNYTVSVYQAREVYRAGPVKRGLLGYLGLPNYKLQWPIANAEKTCA